MVATADPKLIKTVHEVSYKGETIRASFEINIQTGERFLQDAYVLNPQGV